MRGAVRWLKQEGFTEDLVCSGWDANRDGDEITDDMISRLESGIWRSLRRTWFHFVPSAARIAVLIAHHPLSLVSGGFLEFSAPHGLLHGFALYVPDWFQWETKSIARLDSFSLPKGGWEWGRERMAFEDGISLWNASRGYRSFSPANWSPSHPHYCQQQQQ